MGSLNTQTLHSKGIFQIMFHIIGQTQASQILVNNESTGLLYLAAVVGKIHMGNP